MDSDAVVDFFEVVVQRAEAGALQALGQAAGGVEGGG